VDAIVVDKLEKKFNGFTAVDKISFTVKKGELFGFLGPNGAGKSTTIYMLTTLIPPTSGTATVNGFDIRTQSEQARKSIGIVFQDQTLDTYLTAYDNLDIHGRLYGMNDAQARNARIKEVLELVELTEWKDKVVKTFSGGMKRRLEIARGLLHTPEILFLDEPTLGLDPQTRRHIWQYIQKLREKGIAMMLTTHYLEEADYLCDRVAIIDRGVIKALDTPANLKGAIGGNVIRIETKDVQKLAGMLSKSGCCEKPRIEGDIVSFEAKDGGKLVPKILESAAKEKIAILNIEIRTPSLEDVFIQYTGSSIREEKGQGGGFMMMRRSHGF